MKAIKEQMDLNVQSVEDIPPAAERAGCEISYVDLPVKVSGFAKVIEGKPHIVVNRAKPAAHRKFTIAHELGHHVLHLNPGDYRNQASLLTDNATEFEASMFAATLITRVTGREEQEEMLAHNPEMRSTLAISILGTVLAILMVVAIWICSRVFHSQISASIEIK